MQLINAKNRNLKMKKLNNLTAPAYQSKLEDYFGTLNENEYNQKQQRDENQQLQQKLNVNYFELEEESQDPFAPQEDEEERIAKLSLSLDRYF